MGTSTSVLVPQSDVAVQCDRERETSPVRGVFVGVQAGESGSSSAPLTCNPGVQTGESGSFPAPLSYNPSKGIGGRHLTACELDAERSGQSGYRSACPGQESGVSGSHSAPPDSASLEIGIGEQKTKILPSGRGKQSQHFSRTVRSRNLGRLQICVENYKKSDI